MIPRKKNRNRAAASGPPALPTKESYKALAEAVAKVEGVDPGMVRINYFQTSDADTVLLNGWLKLEQTASQSGQGPYCSYFVGGHNCATFTANGLVVGNAISSDQARRLSIDPNLMFGQLSGLANDNFRWLDLIKHEKACTTIQGPNGPETHCVD